MHFMTIIRGSLIIACVFGIPQSLQRRATPQPKSTQWDYPSASISHSKNRNSQLVDSRDRDGKNVYEQLTIATKQPPKKPSTWYGDKRPLRKLHPTELEELRPGENPRAALQQPKTEKPLAISSKRDYELAPTEHLQRFNFWYPRQSRSVTWSGSVAYRERKIIIQFHKLQPEQEFQVEDLLHDLLKQSAQKGYKPIKTIEFVNFPRKKAQSNPWDFPEEAAVLNRLSQKSGISTLGGFDVAVRVIPRGSGRFDPEFTLTYVNHAF